MGAQKNHLIETVLLSTNNICFGGEIRKLFFWYTQKAWITLTNSKQFGPRSGQTAHRSWSRSKTIWHSKSVPELHVIFFEKVNFEKKLAEYQSRNNYPACKELISPTLFTSHCISFTFRLFLCASAFSCWLCFCKLWIKFLISWLIGPSNWIKTNMRKA